MTKKAATKNIQAVGRKTAGSKTASGKLANTKPKFATAKSKTPPVKAKSGVKTTSRASSIEAKLKTAVDNVSSAIMMVDRDFIVTYANETTRTMLAKHEADFRQIWPNFVADKIIGTCIDTFHKHPGHQRTLLADPKNLPFRTDISVGPLRFSLCVSAILEADGTYSGNILEWANVTEIRKQEALNADYSGQIAAIGRGQAVCEFLMDGSIVTANQNYLNAIGYLLDDIKGKHFSILLDEKQRNSAEIADFWSKLKRGEFQSGEYKRLRKNGTDVWFQGSYNPIYDIKGQLCKVVEYSSDITAAKEKRADFENQLRSISTYQAVIEFKLDGTIVDANQNFLNATGYTLGEIQGKHHSMFVDNAYRQTQDYRLFWDRLGRGEAESGQYKRLRKNGSEVWLQASYNPILDLSGKPCKVIKYASDITEHKVREEQMARAMSETGRVMKAVAAGDLRNTMEGEFEGEFGRLRDNVNDCVERLREIIGQVRHGMSTLAHSASEIATGNLDLSQRTEEQAASLATTAANMEELTATVKRNADNANQANKLASGARHHAEDGGLVVANAITAMRAINQASNNISEIIGVIDDIAFQTNLLALNAAVEAARAGEQGRGFAVVAAEVRNLAQRSAGAAKEIKGLIKDSVTRVEEGSRLVNESGSTLEQIVNAAKKVSDIISEIAAASGEQTQGIEKVTEAVQQMDVAVQQNSALVEETSAASNMMDDQTRHMSTLISFFKMSDDDTAFAATPKRETTTVAKPKTTAKVQPLTKRPVAQTSQVKAPEFSMSEEF